MWQPNPELKGTELGPTCLDASPLDRDSSVVFVGCEDGNVYECQLLGKDTKGRTRQLKGHEGMGDD